VEARHEGKIDLLLTDIVMPGMNGRVLAEKLLTKHPGTRVLYISGYTDSFIAVQGALEQGMALLHKPFTEEALIRKVREVLDAKSAAAGEPETTEVIGQDQTDPR
jgi:YesN/AraC family two-component response regulator